MAITLYGVDPSIDEAKWAQLHALATDTRVTGLAVSVGSGTRVLSVGTGEAYTAGVLAQSTTTGTVTLATNTSGQPRIDYVVLEINWAGTQTTGGTLKSVNGTPGSSPVAPNLTQVAGTVWQIPLARVTLAADNATMSIEQARNAVAPRPVPYTADIPGTGNIAVGATQNVVTITVADPGWKYQVQVSGAVEFNNFGGTGFARVDCLVDGEQIATTRSGNGNASMAFLTPAWSSARSGARTTVRLTVRKSDNYAGGEQLVVQGSGSRLTVVAFPVN